MSIPVKKIYVDTKYKTRDSVSTSNFKIELPETLLFPDNCVFYIDDVCIPHSWYVVEEGVNDKLYIYLTPAVPDEDSTGITYSIIQISSGNYTGADLAAELQLQFTKTINNSLHPNMFSTTYNAKKNSITIVNTYEAWKFKVMTPNDISTKLNNTWLGEYYNPSNPQDMNDIIGNLEGNSRYYYLTSPYNSNALNLQSIRNIYIHSPNLGSYTTIGPQGERTIIKKVPVTANQNEMIFDQVMTGNDFSDCSKMTLKTLEFYLRDSRGNYINFHGSDLSFSIIFTRMNPDS
jgi:hypothetical protein